MTTIGSPSRVVAIGNPGATLQQITAALSSQAEFQLLDVISNPERLVRELRAATPDIILIDHDLAGQPTLDLIDDISAQFPEVAIISILAGEDPQHAQQVTLAGARAFLVQPFSQIALLSTLRRVRDLEMRRIQIRAAVPAVSAESTRPLKSIAVYSPKGGVGCSTLALNLALALHEETSRSVLLLEGKIFFGHLGVMLNIRSQNTMAELLPHASHLDDGLVREVVTEHASGIYVLPAPRNFQVAQGVRPDDLYNIYLTLQRLYDYVIVDVGSSLTENAVTFLDTVDRILLVTNPDLGSLHDSSLFMQISRSLGYPSDKLLMVLNRVGLSGGVRTDDIEGALHQPVFAQIPEEKMKPLLSLNRGIPLLVRYPRSKASRMIRRLAKALADVRVAVPVSEAVSANVEEHRKALLASSQLG